MYDGRVGELHPLAVKSEAQGRGKPNIFPAKRIKAK